MTRGRAATPDPFDLSAVNRSDELFDALSTRRFSGHADSDDPAAALLAALVADVDADAPPLPARLPWAGPSARRRGTRAFVSFGVAALVLTSAGAAAAGGGNGTGALGGTHGQARPKSTERSNENAERQDPVLSRRTLRRPSVRRTPLTPVEESTRGADPGQWGDHRTRRAGKNYSHAPVDLRRSPNHPRTPGGGRPSATPDPTPSPSES